MSNRIYFAGAILIALCAGFIAAQQTTPVQPKVPVVTQATAGPLHDPKTTVILTSDQRIALLEQATQTLQQEITALQSQLTALSNNALTKRGDENLACTSFSMVQVNDVLDHTQTGTPVGVRHYDAGTLLPMWSDCTVPK
jgi:hypothetical protein